MPALPQIADSAKRSLLPSADFNPRAATGADMGGQVGAALQDAGQAVQGLANSVEGFQLAKARDQKQLRDFTLSTNFIQFASDENTRLAQAQQDMPSGGWEFQKNFVLSHAANAEQWLQTNGVTDPRDQAEWRQRLAQLQSGVSSDALRAEFTERNRFYGEQTNTALDTLQTTINQNPDGYDATLAQGDAVIDQADLPPAVKDSRRALWRRQAAAALGTAILQRDPSALIAATGGPVTEAGDYTGSGASNPAERHIFSTARSSGMSGVAAAAFAGTFSHEGAGANPNAVNRGDGTDGSDSIGIGQWNGARAAALKAFAQERGVPWNTVEVQTDFALHELKTTEPEAYRRLMSATTIDKAVEAMNYYERPQGWTNGGDPSRVAGWTDRVARATRIAGQPATETRPPEGAVDPRLAALSYEDRLALQGQAARGIQQNIQQAAAAQQAQHAQYINDFLLDLTDGKKGAEDIAAARAAGQLTDVDEVARANNIVAQRAQQNADINAFDAAWANPNAAWNPFDSDQKKAVDAGFQRNPTMENLQAIVQRTNIVPPSAASLIRGQLLSSDPTKVGQAASIAANVMAHNPNAFGAVDGARDIQEAGSLYNHLVNDLGFTAQEASTRIAERNDPRTPERTRLTPEGATAFRQRVTRRLPLGSIISDLGGHARTISTEQDAALQQDYADLAIDHYQRHGDERAAEAWARDRIKVLYGISNGTLVKYPPEHVYPAVAGSHDYIYAQAAAAVAATASRAGGTHQIEPRNVYLVPTPLTGEAWRQGVPAQYSIHFTFEQDGHRVYDVLPGSYVFHPDRAAAEATRAQQARDQANFTRIEGARRAQRAMAATEMPGGRGIPDIRQ